MKIKRHKANVALAVFVLLFSPTVVHADTGSRPTSKITVTVDGKPFDNALISVQRCEPNGQADFTFRREDYSISGLGYASSIDFQGNFIASVLEADEDGKNLDEKALLEELAIEVPWSEEQLKKAREFVLSEYDKEKQCFWEPSYRAYTNCVNVSCEVRYWVPTYFRLKVLDLDSGETYVTQEVQNTAFNSVYAVNFDSTTRLGELIEKPGERGISVLMFVLFFFINLVLELLAATVLAYFVFKINVKKIIAPVIIGNLISHPIVYFVPQLLTLQMGVLVLFSLEIAAVLFEAFVIKKLVKIGWRKALAVSVIINFVSFFIGGVVPLIG